MWYDDVYMQGDDVCGLEQELSLEARLKAAGTEGSDVNKQTLDGVPPTSALAQTRRQTVSNTAHHHDGETLNTVQFCTGNCVCVFFFVRSQQRNE